MIICGKWFAKSSAYVSCVKIICTYSNNIHAYYVYETKLSLFLVLSYKNYDSILVIMDGIYNRI